MSTNDRAGEVLRLLSEGLPPRDRVIGAIEHEGGFQGAEFMRIARANASVWAQIVAILEGK